MRRGLGLALASVLALLALLWLRGLVGGARAPQIATGRDGTETSAPEDAGPSVSAPAATSHREGAVAPAGADSAPGTAAVDRPVETLASADGVQVLVRMKD